MHTMFGAGLFQKLDVGFLNPWVYQAVEESHASATAHLQCYQVASEFALARSEQARSSPEDRWF